MDLESSKLTPDISKLSQLKMDLEIADQEEEQYWKQQSKEKWVVDGDKNTQYFHDSVKTRKMRNHVPSLTDNNGMKHFSESAKGDIAVSYFVELFQSSNHGILVFLRDLKVELKRG